MLLLLTRHFYPIFFAYHTDVVADVDNYKSFLPYCTQSAVLRRVPPNFMLVRLFDSLQVCYSGILSRLRAVHFQQRNVIHSFYSLLPLMIPSWTIFSPGAANRG